MLAGFGAISLSIILFFFLYKISAVAGYVGILLDVLMPFFYGGILAYLLYPFSKWIYERIFRISGEKHERLAKYIGVYGAVALLFLVIYLLLAMVLPQLIDSIVSLVTSLPGTVDKTALWIETILEDNEPLRNEAEKILNNSYAQFQTWMEGSLIPQLKTLITELSGSVIDIVMGMLDFVIGIIVCIYILFSAEKFKKQAKMIVNAIFPKKAADMIFDITEQTDQSFGGFIRGKLLDSLIIGIICFLCMSLLHFPYVMLISVVVGVTNIIPFFGPFIGAIPSAILILTVSPIQSVYFLLFILVLQQIDGNIIGPTILGQSTGISSIWVLFSILVFGSIFGVFGMIIGVPLFSVLYDLFRKWIFGSLKKKGMEEEITAYRKQYPQKKQEKKEE